MVNQLRPWPREAEEKGPVEDYFEIHTDLPVFYVSREVADEVLAVVACRWPPRWIRFKDLHGSEIWIRSRRVVYVRERSSAQREAGREFRRARREEEEADRWMWDGDW